MARSFIDVMASLNPDYRLAQRKQLVHEQIEQAKMTLQQQHHYENMQFNERKLQVERDKINQRNDQIARQEQLEREAIQGGIEKECIAGENALRLSRNNFFQDELAKDTDLIHKMFGSFFDRRRDWKNRLAETQKSLYETEADTIRQKSLQRQKHEQEMEQIRLEHQLRMQENQQGFRQQIGMEQYKASIEQNRQRQKRVQELHKAVLDYNLRVFEKVIANVIQNKRVTYDSLNSIIVRILERLLGLGEQQISDDDIKQYVKEAMREL